MPQYPLVPAPGGTATTLDIAAATVIKSSPGRVFTVSVFSLGSAVGAIYDSASTSGNTVANQLAVIPEAVGTYSFNAMPTATGIVVVPPTTSTISVSWS